METPAWMMDELVKDIPKEKLQLLFEMQSISSEITGKQLLSSLLPLLRKAKEQKLTFTKEEMDAAIRAIKKYATAEELQNMSSSLAQKGLHVDLNLHNM